MYTEFAIKICDFNQRLTKTLLYHQNEAPMCLILLASITQVCLLVNFARSSSLFFEFLKVTIAGQSSIHRLAWKTTTKLYGFSDTKV